MLLKSRIFFITLLIIFVQTHRVSSSMLWDNTFTCPVCETTFKEMVDISGSWNDQRLDLKPVGAVIAPSVIPKCPKCGFLVFKDEFQSNEGEQIRSIISTKEYQQLARNNSSYYLIAYLMEKMGTDNLTLAYIYLKASWQVEDDSLKYSHYLRCSLEKFNNFLNTQSNDSRERGSSQLLAGELERRLGRFDDSEQRFKQLSAEDNNLLIDYIIRYELSLLRQKDSAPHNYSEIRVYASQTNLDGVLGGLIFLGWTIYLKISERKYSSSFCIVQRKMNLK
jgi:uncharacterized protein (DUF2225 family)